MEIEEEYTVYFKENAVGCYWVYEDGSSEYDTGYYAFIGMDKNEVPPEIMKTKSSKKSIPYFKKIMTDSNRVKGTRKTIYERGDVKIARIPKDIDRFSIYRRSAEKGDPDYSERDHSAPHCEGNGPIDGMREWASWYCFNKKDDGMFEAELDEAWWWGGGHNDGGTIRVEVPEEWLELPYEEYLENVVTLAAAKHYGFTAEDLAAKPGLKEFFGF